MEGDTLKEAGVIVQQNKKVSSVVVAFLHHSLPLALFLHLLTYGCQPTGGGWRRACLFLFLVIYGWDGQCVSCCYVVLVTKQDKQQVGHDRVGQASGTEGRV